MSVWGVCVLLRARNSCRSDNVPGASMLLWRVFSCFVLEVPVVQTIAWCFNVTVVRLELLRTRSYCSSDNVPGASMLLWCA